VEALIGYEECFSSINYCNNFHVYNLSKLIKSEQQPTDCLVHPVLMSGQSSDAGGGRKNKKIKQRVVLK